MALGGCPTVTARTWPRICPSFSRLLDRLCRALHPHSPGARPIWEPGCHRPLAGLSLVANPIVPLTTASPGGDPRLPVDEPEDAEPDDQQGGIWICRCHCWAASEQRFLPIEERWRSCRDGGGFFGQKIREVGERVSLTTLAASRPSVCLLGPGFTKSKRLQAHSPATVKTWQGSY